LKKASKFLSYILRHKPKELKIQIDECGWADIDDIIKKSKQEISQDMIFEVVKTSDKKRFALSPCKTLIRANQGHSFNVNLELVAQKPPKKLYHGTAQKNVDSIMDKGLIKGQRQYVHLSNDIETARKVGMRHGSPVILAINSWKMSENKLHFYLSENGVWLCDFVPRQYISLERC